jgi:hypothetical protein
MCSVLSLSWLYSRDFTSPVMRSPLTSTTTSVLGAAESALEKARSDASSSREAVPAPASAFPRLACRVCDEENMARRSLDANDVMLPRVSPP